TDASGNGNNLTASGGPSYSSGVLNNAVSLNGSSQNLSRTYTQAKNYNSSAFTFVAWVKWNAFSNYQHVFTVWDGSNRIYMATSADRSLQFAWDEVVNFNGAVVTARGVEGWKHVLSPNVWYHVA